MEQEDDMTGDTNKVKVRDLSGDAELFHLTNAAGEEYSTIEVGGFEWLSCPREDEADMLKFYWNKWRER
jgi:hypothetical protein